MNYGFSISAKIVLSKSILDVKNQSNFFQKKILSKNINLGNHFLVKTFFSKLNFWTTLLSKITPNFWQTLITRRNFLKIFPWWHVDSWPNTFLFRTHHLQNSTTELILSASCSICCLQFYKLLSFYKFMLVPNVLWKIIVSKTILKSIIGN